MNARHLVFLLLLTALPESCKTSTPVPPQTPEQRPQSEKAEAPAKGNTESTEAEQKPTESPVQRLPESVLSAPERNLALTGKKYDTVLQVRTADGSIDSGWQYRKDQQSKIVGFEFSNRGGNPILPNRYDIEKNRFFTRDFQFRFDDRARQDIYLFISDWVPSRDREFRLSELMNSVMLFFPRNYLPAIVRSDGRTVVTLPTGEEIEFDAKTHEVSGGVFSEEPVDLNPDKATRKFPRVHYKGKGIAIRANARGTDPRVGTMATITTGSPPTDCEGTGCDQCQVPSKELWDQSGAVRFRFSADEEFNRYLMSRCGFGIPQWALIL